jgi:hypothetical protein
MYYRKGPTSRTKLAPSAFKPNGVTCNASLIDPSGIVRETSVGVCGEAERSCEWPLEIPITPA